MSFSSFQRRQRPFALQTLAQAAIIALSAPVMVAQAQDASKLERVEITGSSIKRVDAETALPVQIIKREDIAKSGSTTAAELLKNISAATANLGDGASITDNTGGQRGFNGANLRGIGVSSTLILLNGRRLANFASPGDSAGVDLNSIPAGAIQRVEVLKDGASAIYGTDAIGGVINFITRQDYTGVDLSGYVADTQEGGAGKKTFTVSGGTGEIAKDGYNVFATLDVQRLDALRSTQRKFIQDRPLTETVPYYLSSRPYPGNIRLASSGSARAEQLAAINAAGYTFSGKPYTQRTINLFAPTCNPPASVYAPTAIGSEACGYDYMADTEIYPKSDKTSFMTRGVVDAGGGKQVFAELLLARAKTDYVLAPNPTTLSGMTWGAINPFLPKPVTNGRTFDIRFRATELGNRTNEVTSDANRVVVGTTGTVFGDWDYTVGASYALNKVSDRYVNGYFKFKELLDAVKAGKINPFGPSPASSKDLISSLRVNDAARKSEGATSGIDAKLTGTLAQLEGGDLGLAVGAEFRRETQKFTPSALLVSNNIGGDRDSSGSSPPLVATDYGRNIVSAYAELNAPVTKQLEIQAAVRADHYDKVGSTFNPKLGLRYQQSKQLVLRASAGTGFRAPSFSELYRPTSYGSSPAFLYDSVYDSFDQYPTEKISNPDLKPEKSKQFSAGVVFEPFKDSAVTLDYWQISKTNVISDLSGKIILENPTRYAAYIKRDADDYPTLILKKENQGGLKTNGLDIDARWRSAPGDLGRVGLNFTGTYVAQYKRQFGQAESFLENAGRFLQDQVIQRWRHRISADWDNGPLSVTLGNSFFSSYADDSYLPDTQPRRVAGYSLWDMSASYKFSKQFSVRGGIQNLLDTAPPYSNQSYYFLSTFDPTYTDPRGRSYYLSFNYSFR
jgi:iron complex outermembrane receptor protein